MECYIIYPYIIISEGGRYNSYSSSNTLLNIIKVCLKSLDKENLIKVSEYKTSNRVILELNRISNDEYEQEKNRKTWIELISKIIDNIISLYDEFD